MPAAAMAAAAGPGGEDVAGGPAYLGAEGDQRLDQHRSLDGHVDTAQIFAP